LLPAADGPTCPNCGRPVDPAALFCEACGAPLAPSAPPAGAASGPAGSGGTAPSGSGSSTDAPSAQTRRLGVRASQQATCAVCGGTIAADGYCQTCGAKAPSPRDHYSQAPAAWVAGVCDRGVQHPRNEDALALWAADGRAVLVVCDGVSTSVDSDVASQAAVERARDVLVAAATSTGPVSGDDWGAALVEATAQANQAVVSTTSPESANAASATVAAAVVVGAEVYYANLGDSRVYLLGETERVLLTVDDSMAQAFIAEGMPRQEAESLPRAHAITKWLGRDAVDIVPRTGAHTVTGSGWLVVCSDGLWNYASDPDALAARLDAALAAGDDPEAVARRLVDWANAQGGQDNVTVALARVPAPAVTLGPAPTDQQKEQPEHG
jgi:serine/threonine protein phosphatase PrpC